MQNIIFEYLKDNYSYTLTDAEIRFATGVLCFCLMSEAIDTDEELFLYIQNFIDSNEISDYEIYVNEDLRYYKIDDEEVDDLKERHTRSKQDIYNSSYKIMYPTFEDYLKVYPIDTYSVMIHYYGYHLECNVDGEHFYVCY